MSDKKFYIQLEVTAIIAVALDKDQIEAIVGDREMKEDWPMDLTRDGQTLIEKIVRQQHADDRPVRIGDHVNHFQLSKEEVETCSKCNRILDHWKKCSNCNRRKS